MHCKIREVWHYSASSKDNHRNFYIPLTAMNIEQARANMLTQQLRTWEVLDPEILDLVARTPREQFVPVIYQDLAFADMNIPLAHGQVMLTPKEEGRILQVLKIKPTDRILEIGTGCGYMTALLAKLGQHVDSVDIFADFSDEARLKLSIFNITNVALFSADAARGWQGKYDVIVITGSLPLLPTNFKQCLNPDGRLFVILGEAPAMEATLLTRNQQNQWFTETLFETVVPPLLNAAAPAQFVF
jgi:protein-L-isoaspartate(D-aspartate) O-methyltransferase